jgi:hypothetical protein
MNDILTNLPPTQSTDSADRTKVYLNNYRETGEEYLSADVDATVGFLTKRGFALEAATVSGMVLLQQAKRDGISALTLLETLGSLQNLQLSALVAEILNQNRSQTSRLGYRSSSTANQIKLRNIRA